ncbi:transposase domain-containing protein [Rhizophagus irregularis DAOM 181602=DAOM 197198]|nr:transposase domain-containing protein [Rhizophagus irregularis DAOM 181602=DAOM 197198]
MSEKVLCKCFICKAKNPELGGKYHTFPTVKKHRKKELEWIKNTNMNSQSIEVSDRGDNIQFQDFYQNTDLTMDEFHDKLLQDNNLNNDNDLQDLSDNDNSLDDNNYDNLEDYENSSDGSLKDYENSSDGSLEDYENSSNGSLEDYENSSNGSLQDDYYMQELDQEYNNYDAQETSFTDDLNNNDFKLNISQDLAQALRLFEIKVRCNLTDNALNQIMRASNISISIYQIKKTLKKLHLKIQYENPNCANELRYQYIYITCNGFGEDDEHDIALTGSVDGYQIFRQKTETCWILLFINANLSPEKWVLKENLLITSIIPGPKEPKDFNSFMNPIVDELKELARGTDCIDGNTKNHFILKAHVLSWSGDTPGLTKLKCFTGHNSYKGCRYCNIKGICVKHVYFSTIPPIGSNNLMSYDANNLPLRSHEEYEKIIRNLNCIITQQAIESLQRNYGIKNQSILYDLPSIKFPSSFALDIMHLMFENVAKYMVKHWFGVFFKNVGENSNKPYILNKTIWTEIGNLMHTARKMIPSYLGRPPRNITLYYNSYKAEEWMAWIIMYSLPLLKDKLSIKYYEGWALFVKAVRLCKKLCLFEEDISEIKILLLNFYKHYEKEYYGGIKENISAIKLCFHYLLHVTDSIRNTGPCWATWQFPMERICGMLIPLAKSCLHPYKNIINNVYLMELFNHLPYHEIYQHVFLSKSSPKQYAQHLIYTDEYYFEEFYFPTKKHILSQIQLKKIKENLSTSYNNITDLNLNSLPKEGIMYGRMLTKNKYFIGSKWINKNNDWARINHTVKVQIEVDKWANFKYRESEFWTKPVTEDNVGVLLFSGFSYYDFIRVSAIDCCVGFFPLGNKYCIIDRDKDIAEISKD